MTPRTKLAGFAVVLLTAFGLGWGLGAAADPVIEPEPPTHEHTSTFGGGHDG